MERGEKKIIMGRYWNTNGMAIAIVAVITEEVDWAAYIGATTETMHEEEAIEWTRKWGAKLSGNDAHHYFPNIELAYRE